MNKTEAKMSYETVLEQIKSAPTECLDEISVVIGNIVEQYKKNYYSGKENFVFDSLIKHTDRANHADEHIRELRDNDRF